MDEQVVAGVLHKVCAGHGVARGPLVVTVLVPPPPEPVVARVRVDDLLHYPHPEAHLPLHDVPSRAGEEGGAT